uniref:Uncharacterized protein n=1 Tax=Populus trichocarpa TaxID=3694 RepID=A0A2K1WUK3_POPTR
MFEHVMYNNSPQYAKCNTNTNIPFVPSQPAMLGLTRPTSIALLNQSNSSTESKPRLCFSYGHFKGWGGTIP